MNSIIVIGMDNTGKTTLVEGLKGEYNNFISQVQGIDMNTIPEPLLDEVEGLKRRSAETIKSPGPLDRVSMYTWCDNQIKRFGSNPDKLVIYDRFGAIEEQIYAPIIRGEETDHVEYLMNSMRYLPWHKTPFIVYARPEEKDILGFADGREQMEGVIENGKELLAAYDNLFFRLQTFLPVTVYRYYKDTPKSLLQEYLKFKTDCLNKYVDTDIEALINHLHSTTSPLIQCLEGESVVDLLGLNSLKSTLDAVHANLALYGNLWKSIEVQGVNLPDEIEKPLLKLHQDLIKVELVLTKKLKELL